jgi:hypothetical protein
VFYRSCSVSVATQIDIYLILFGAQRLTKRDEATTSYVVLRFFFECSCLQSCSVSVATQIDIYLILFGAHGLTKRDEATTSYVVLREKVLPKPIETHDGGK